jgi:excinuclease UvrABC nuclease subunit
MRLFNRPIILHPGVFLCDRQNLPRSPGVYYAIQWFRPWRPLYVGMSGNIHKRWNSEGDRRHHKLSELSRYRGMRLHYRATQTRDEALDLEADEIHRLQPPLNRKKEPRRFRLIREIKDWFFDSLVLGSIGFVLLKIIGW